MNFDLTKEIKLDKKNYLHYQRWQIFFYGIYFFLLFYLTYLIFFPTQEFNFSFVSANKGNVINPRNEEEKKITTGKFPADKITYFDSSLIGNFSQAKITLTSTKNSLSPENSKLSLRKSYKAFLYPEGNSIGFKNGTLLRNKNNLYLISAGNLRKFQNKAIFIALGFSEEALIDVSEEDLNQNPSDKEITDTIIYPVNSIFKIKNDYYYLNTEGTLEKFISEKAYLSNYADNLAIPKNSDFLNKFSLAKNSIGFSDGTLVSYGNSVYIASEKKLYPIGDPNIFINQGFNWNDIINIDGNEFSFYEKEKMFTLASAHPNGTIFLTTDLKEWYIIKDNQKHKLASKKIAQSWSKKNPITIQTESSTILESCIFKKNFWRETVCIINLAQTSNFYGVYYEFSLQPENDFQLNNLNIKYKKNVTKKNLKSSMGELLSKIALRYNFQKTL